MTLSNNIHRHNNIPNISTGKNITSCILKMAYSTMFKCHSTLIFFFNYNFSILLKSLKRTVIMNYDQLKNTPLYGNFSEIYNVVIYILIHHKHKSFGYILRNIVCV